MLRHHLRAVTPWRSRSPSKVLPSLWRSALATSHFPGIRCGYASVSAGELQFGQPVYETHPHILKAGELTRGITALEYAQRRARLAARLPENAIAVIPASDLKYRSGPVFYEFHQDPNFFYLTGFNEPESLAIIERTGSDGDHIFHLFVRPKDPEAEKWDGARSGLQAALDIFNADEVGDINRVQTQLPSIIARASEVYTDVPNTITARTAFGRFFSSGPPDKEGFAKMLRDTKVRPLRPILNQLRVYKSAAEISNMRIAGQASGRAFTDAMRHRFSEEAKLYAFMEYNFKLRGCDTSAYVPVVAGGKNALSIHYVQNNDRLSPEELVLVDAGGEYGGYITDITRTWPISGKFTGAQKDLYEAILKIQRSCVSLCREDSNFSLDKLHDIAQSGLERHLKDIGFDMSGNAIETLFPHHLGHYIGLDVHDCSGYSRRDSLKSGQCITIEPGIYVPDDERWPKHFRGIGIRIEDSVCIQEDSPFIFTTEAVKEVVDIEALAD